MSHPKSPCFDPNQLLGTMIEPLLAWYEQNCRPLPWRNEPTPYHVWLSEIMLQQTRIEAVIPYYERFLSAFPTVEALAEADDERLMKLWEGLGYYSRARNLKKAAVYIMQQHGGTMPSTYEELRLLPGIGDYTAGAIASIAFGLPEPAVDGNVLRVVTRLTANPSDITKQATKRCITEQLRRVYPSEPDRAAATTQALMELGERVCLPNGAPQCDRCPLGTSCLARAQDLVDRIPVRTPKKPRRIQQKTVFLLCCDSRVAVCKRPLKGLLAGLWEFPSSDVAMSEEQARAYLSDHGFTVKEIKHATDATHVFTHIEWHMQGYFVHCVALPDSWNGTPLRLVTRANMQEKYALPSAFRAFVRALDQEHFRFDNY